MRILATGKGRRDKRTGLGSQKGIERFFVYGAKSKRTSGIGIKKGFGKITKSRV